MAALRPEQLADFVELTLSDYKRDAWVDIAMPLQRYTIMSRLLQKNRVSFDGGKNLQWQINVGRHTAARNTGLYAEDQTSASDTVKSLNVPWTFQDAYFIYDEREDELQSSPEKIVSVIDIRKVNAMNDLIALGETNFWGMPTSSTDETELLKPFGVPYWVTSSAGDAVTSSFAFTGGDHPLFTSGKGGVSSGDYSAWANGSATYKSVTKTGLVRAWREAATKCDFRAPTPHATPHPDAQDNAYFMNYNVLGVLEEVLESQNDNLGNDLASKDGQVVFRSNPCVWVPYLDQNTITENSVDMTDPIYGLDLNVFKCVFKSGWFMKWRPPKPAPTQHTVKEVFVDTSCQFLCYDLRRNFVFYRA